MRTNDTPLELRHCQLCPRHCGIDRTRGQRGVCGAGAEVQVSKVMLHHWEEPCISGVAYPDATEPEARGKSGIDTSTTEPDTRGHLRTHTTTIDASNTTESFSDKIERGSGAVFFSHCALGCVYCQNRVISRRDSAGRTLNTHELADMFLDLENRGAYNLNLVTPTHYTSQILDALTLAKSKGLTLPVVWNTGGYESAAVLEQLDGLVDVYLTDYKYADPDLAQVLSHARDYPVVAEAALRIMLSQVGAVQFDDRGMLTRGVIVRHLCLPGCRRDSLAVLSKVASVVEECGMALSDLRLSLMRQYTPEHLEQALAQGDVSDEIPPSLLRRVTTFEYETVLAEATRLGYEGYTQEKTSASRRFTPDF